MALIFPQGTLCDQFSHCRGRSSYSKALSADLLHFRNLHASNIPVVRRQKSSRPRILECAAVRGGSKRDVEKLVAKTKHQRPRHKKGMTPSKTDLLEELEEEKETEVSVQDEISQLVGEDNTLALSEDGNTLLHDGSNSDAKIQENTMEGHGDHDSDSLLNVVNNVTGVQGIVNSAEETAVSVIDSAADVQKQMVNDTMERGKTLAEGINAIVSEQPNRAASEVKESGEGGIDVFSDGDQDSEGLSSLNVMNNVTEGVQGIVDSAEDTAISVIDRAADVQKQITSDAMERGKTLAEGTSAIVSEKRNRAASKVKESGEGSIGIISNGSINVGSRSSDSRQQMSEDIVDVTLDIRDDSHSQIHSTIHNNKEELSAADEAKDMASDANQKFNESGGRLREDLSKTLSAGQRLAENGSAMIGQQAKELKLDAENMLQEQGGRLEQASMKLQSEASKSMGRVQDSVQKALEESTGAARSIQTEALRMGELLRDTGSETIESASKIFLKTPTETGRTTQEHKSEMLIQDVEPQVTSEKDKQLFDGLKVLVAGASGQTGRLIVEQLVANGASVRGMVRDVYKAQRLPQIRGCEYVKADLYNYEAVRNALGDCNVVICAIGARAFPLDILKTYQVEYEGVINLVSAAKNQGNLKKFILISTIGATYLQLVPLIFWKKQAELYLQRSGLDYTIVRPGGLRNTAEPEQVVMQGADSQFFGGISRQKVAEVCTSALISADASHKIVEVISLSGTQRRSVVDLFKSV